MVTLPLYLACVGAVALERVAELVLSRRNARAALAAGAVEVARGHYAPMVVLHAAFLASCAAEPLAFPAAAAPALAVPLLGLAAAAQGLRWWSVKVLGARWTTRVIADPQATPVTGGPYRYLRHPNYVAVAIELAALPLAYGSWRTALAFSIGNAALMAVRIPAEERALGAQYASAFATTPRFVPARRGAAATGER